MTQGYLDFPPCQQHSATSVAAAEAITPKRATLRAKVLAFIADRPDGATDEEIIDGTGMSPSTARPRRIELVHAGKVIDTGRTRQTRSGRSATVWSAVPLSVSDAAAGAPNVPGLVAQTSVETSS